MAVDLHSGKEAQVMPKDIHGKEPGDKGYTYKGLTPSQKAQAQAIAISITEQKHKKGGSK